jgi:hypothetical protein
MGVELPGNVLELVGDDNCDEVQADLRELAVWFAQHEVLENQARAHTDAAMLERYQAQDGLRTLLCPNDPSHGRLHFSGQEGQVWEACWSCNHGQSFEGDVLGFYVLLHKAKDAP